jgi:hypothetical protein
MRAPSSTRLLAAKQQKIAETEKRKSNPVRSTMRLGKKQGGLLFNIICLVEEVYTRAHK